MMASIAPSNPTRWERVWHNLKMCGGVVFAALVAAALTYLFTAKLNTEAALQQQYLAAVQDYIETGASLDSAVTNLADSILDGQEVRPARQAARAAIAAHVAATRSLSEIVGKGNSNLYMKGLAALRQFVDAANDKASAEAMSNARFDVMDNRNIIVTEARRRIYE